MKPAHPPKYLILVILILVTAAFLGGTLRLIPRAHAADINIAGSQTSFHQAREAALNPGLDLALTATPTLSGTPTTISASADTGGIIALAFVIVVTVILGAVMGVRASFPGKNPIKK